MPVDTRQLRGLSAELRALAPVLRARARIAVLKACADTKRDAQAAAPVDTGALRSSISIETRTAGGEVVGEVGPTVEYGVFVELGTSRMPGQPFLGPAFDRHAPLFEQAFDSLPLPGAPGGAR